MSSFFRPLALVRVNRRSGSLIHIRTSRGTNRLLLCFAAVAVTVWAAGCGSRSPLSPDAGLVTISGYVYFRAPSGGEPRIDHAVISVEDDGGSQALVVTNADGFYSMAVQAGRISITASKEGFEAKAWHIQLSSDTVLNFSLTPN